MTDARRLYPDFDVTRSWDLPFIPVEPNDESLEVYLRRMGFTDAQISYTRRSWSNAACEAPNRISAEAALLDFLDTSAGTGEFRIVEGYDKLIEHQAQGLDIRLNTVITAINWGQTNVTVTTSNNEAFQADNVVIAVPLGVLKSGKIKFTPDLPAMKQNAINRLIMGAALKLVYLFDEPVLKNEQGEDIAALYSAGTPPMWWTPTYLRTDANGQPLKQQVITAFATGDYARDLLAKGEQGALEAGLATLKAELGRDDLRPTKMHLMDWTSDEFALGGYSVPPVGGIGLRSNLAQPVDNQLFWAGEATARNTWAATVHGAFASGRRAAQEILGVTS